MQRRKNKQRYPDVYAELRHGTDNNNGIVGICLRRVFKGFPARRGTVPIHLVDGGRKERKHMEKSFQPKKSEKQDINVEACPHIPIF